MCRLELRAYRDIQLRPRRERFITELARTRRTASYKAQCLEGHRPDADGRSRLRLQFCRSELCRGRRAERVQGNMDITLRTPQTLFGVVSRVSF